MRVNHSGNSPVQNGEVHSKNRAGKAAQTDEAKESKLNRGAAAGESAQVEGGSVEVSSKAKDFAQAKKVASETPDVREEKIAELKRRIAAGSYKVDHNAVAERMVDEHLRSSGIG